MKLVDDLRSAVIRSAWRRRGVTGLDAASFIGRPTLSIRPGATVSIGARFVAVSSARRQVIGVNHPTIVRAIDASAVLRIGDDCGFSGTTIVAQTRVEIGDGCLAGANTMIVDTNFHPVHSSNRRRAPIPPPAAANAIVIGRNVFLGAGSVVLKGVTIGDNAVIGAHSVVHTDVPENAIVAGNPARVIGEVRTDDEH